ncbi:hypothetical protein HDU67_000413 [Dinochytrium kinnereticum]|nr:hypothetical protein HDU67_000413 [Dinochytrium kinnereticum]
MGKTASDYILRIRAGPGYDPQALKVVNVNDEKNPLLIDSEHFTGYLVVRMLNFHGVVPDDHAPPIQNPQSSYFQGRHRRYSIMLQGRWKKAWSGQDVIFGLDCPSKIRTPPGVGLAVKIAKWLDPGLDADLTANEPWIYSAFVSAMNSLAIYRVDDPEIWDMAQEKQTEPIPANVETKKPLLPFTKKKNLIHPPSALSQDSLNNCAGAKIRIKPQDAPYPANQIGIWSYHSRLIPEDSKLLFESPPPNPLTTYEKRKQYFADEAARKSVTLSPDYVYCMDFFDCYFDFNTISLRLPGFSLNAMRYFDGQPFRFVCRSRDRSTTFFAVHFELLERESLGMKSDETQSFSEVAEGVCGNNEFPPELLPPPEVLSDELVTPS